MVSSLLCISHDSLVDVHEARLPKGHPPYANCTINAKKAAFLLLISDLSWGKLLILKSQSFSPRKIGFGKVNFAVSKYFIFRWWVFYF